jgi:hypothetical protein
VSFEALFQGTEGPICTAEEAAVALAEILRRHARSAVKAISWAAPSAEVSPRAFLALHRQLQLPRHERVTLWLSHYIGERQLRDIP